MQAALGVRLKKRAAEGILRDRDSLADLRERKNIGYFKPVFFA